MTQRKPRGVSFETWVERQIREATDRGEFDDLPGRGEPIADLDRPRDELWWIRQKLQSENVSYLPPTLALRKEAEDTLTAALDAGSEVELRRMLTAINDKIREANRMPPAGPPLNLMPFDVEAAVEEWRTQHASPDPVAKTEPTAAHPPASDAKPARRWLRRRR